MHDSARPQSADLLLGKGKFYTFSETFSFVVTPPMASPQEKDHRKADRSAYLEHSDTHDLHEDA